MESDQDTRSFTARERFKARLIGLAGYLVIACIGRTMRFRSVGGENLDATLQSGHRAIFTLPTPFNSVVVSKLVTDVF